VFWWGPNGNWVFGLISALFWIALIVAAVMLLRGELPHLRLPEYRSPALRVLEERYARGEISREEFLERREVLLRRPAATDPPTQPVPPPSPPERPPPPSPPEPPAAPAPPPAPGKQSPHPDEQATTNSEPSGPSAPPGAAPASWPEPSREVGEPTEPLPEAPRD
jgi:hypothetical protein